MEKTLIEWGYKVREEKYELSEKDINEIIPRFYKESGFESWAAEKKEFWLNGFASFVGNIGCLKTQPKSKVNFDSVIKSMISKEVGTKYAEEHDHGIVNKSTVVDVLSRLTEGKGAYLEGQTGVGKTHTLVELIYLISRFLGSTKDIKYYSYGELFAILKAGKPYEKKKFVFIDDLKESPAQWFDNLLESFFESLYADNACIVVTSNIKLNDFRAERITSRLSQVCESYELTGYDRRKN